MREFTLAEINKSAKIAGFLALAQTALTIGLVIIAYRAQPDHKLTALFADRAVLIDIVIFIFGAIGIFRKSRIAIIVLILYNVYAFVGFYLITEKFNGFYIRFILLYFYGRAAFGIFQYRKQKSKIDPYFKRPGIFERAFVWIYALTSLAIVILALGFTFSKQLGLTTPTQVMQGDTLSPEIRQALIDNEVIYPFEIIERYYFWGLSDPLEIGVLLTNYAVIYYFKDEGGVVSGYAIQFDQIAKIELLSRGDSFVDSLIRIEGIEPDVWMEIPLSAEMGGDIEFIKAVKSHLPSI